MLVVADAMAARTGETNMSVRGDRCARSTDGSGTAEGEQPRAAPRRVAYTRQSAPRYVYGAVPLSGDAGPSFSCHNSQLHKTNEGEEPRA